MIFTPWSAGLGKKRGDRCLRSGPAASTGLLRSSIIPKCGLGGGKGRRGNCVAATLAIGMSPQRSFWWVRWQRGCPLAPKTPLGDCMDVTFPLQSSCEDRGIRWGSTGDPGGISGCFGGSALFGACSRLGFRGIRSRQLSPYIILKGGMSFCRRHPDLRGLRFYNARPLTTWEVRCLKFYNARPLATWTRWMSVGRSVGRSVDRPIRRSVGRSVGRSLGR